jgi:DNA-binding transcriptional MerR regulator
MTEPQAYITLEEAAKRLGVRRATLYYYMKTLGIAKQKFPLDKRVYLTVADFERIQALKEAARLRRGEPGGEPLPPPSSLPEAA